MKFSDFSQTGFGRYRRFRGFTFGDGDDGLDFITDTEQASTDPTTSVPLLLAAPQQTDYTSMIMGQSSPQTTTSGDPSWLSQALTVAQGLITPNQAQMVVAPASASKMPLMLGGLAAVGLAAFLLMKK